MMLEKTLELIKARNVKELKVLLADATEMEILHALHELPPNDLVIVFKLLAKDVAMSVFDQLDTDEQRVLLRSFADEKTIEFVNELAPDDRVKLLDELPASVANKLISSLSTEERLMTNLLMGYKPESAGRIMTPEYISLRKDMTAKVALNKVRNQAKDKETIYTLFVTDNLRKLEGVITLKELLVADDSTLIEDIMTPKAISVSTDTDQEEVARVLQELDLLAIPVVDSEQHIVGIVTIDDAVDILEEEATEDILDQAGFADITGVETDRSEILVKGSLWKIWRVRIPFLLVTLAAGMLAALIIEGFEATLQSITVVAFFIPLIMDMGGNVGTQSSTVFVRGVVLGHINVRSFMKPFLKEVGIGFSMGLLIGAAAGIITAIWQSDTPMIGLAVGLALMLTMTLASLLGFLVPFILLKLNMDQAAGSAPIITSIKDIAGLLIYFVLVMLFLGNMM